ncbi:hypothetical protein [Nocardia rhamnosiphila]|uniref:SnoaL-like domain-containing protein n=1 Tax=Nocardia rhamnosiphila TaxID=426716 RepID=A0ABV2WYW0_9NOCA
MGTVDHTRFEEQAQDMRAQVTDTYRAGFDTDLGRWRDHVHAEHLMAEVTSINCAPVSAEPNTVVVRVDLVQTAMVDSNNRIPESTPHTLMIRVEQVDGHWLVASSKEQ